MKSWHFGPYCPLNWPLLSPGCWPGSGSCRWTRRRTARTPWGRGTPQSTCSPSHRSKPSQSINNNPSKYTYYIHICFNMWQHLYTRHLPLHPHSHPTPVRPVTHIAKGLQYAENRFFFNFFSITFRHFFLTSSLHLPVLRPMELQVPWWRIILNNMWFL